MKILFVCTGNTCRSSMAGAIALRDLSAAGAAAVEVQSAGTFAVAGLPASEQAVAVMKEMGVDLAGHRSSPLDREMVEGADLVLTMTAGQRQAVLKVCPGAAGRVFTLAEYAGLGGDITDPYGGGLEVYRFTAGQIAGMVRLSVDRLVREMAGRNPE